jgi:hypothetical protein
MPIGPVTSVRLTPEIDPSLLDALEAAIARHITVEVIAADGGRAASVQVDRIDVGEATIDKVTIDGFSSHVRCGAVLLRNVRAILELHFQVRWSYDLKWFGSDEGVKTLGSKAKTVPLHDIRVPMLRDIALDVPTVDVTDVAAAVQPVTEVALGGVGFEGLAIDVARLPSSGFRVSGLGFRSVEIARIAVPDAGSAGVRIARFSPDAPLRLPDVSASHIRIPEAEIPDVGSVEPVSLMDIGIEAFEAPVFKIGDFFKAVFVATPVLHLQIGELVLSDLSASASIDAVRVEGVTTPVEVRGVRVRDLALRGLAAEGIRI